MIYFYCFIVSEKFVASMALLHIWQKYIELRVAINEYIRWLFRRTLSGHQSVKDSVEKFVRRMSFDDFLKLAKFICSTNVGYCVYESFSPSLVLAIADVNNEWVRCAFVLSVDFTNICLKITCIAWFILLASAL